MDIGKNIQELRKKNRITQETLAYELGVSMAAVSKWENEKTIPDIQMLCQLADFFEVTTDELLSRSKREKFIVCDDAPIIRHCMKDILEKQRFLNTKVVSTGKKLFEVLNEAVPYGILDIGLPDMNGLDILRKIKQEYSEIHVIILTADCSEKSKIKAIEYGADAYITKLFRPEHICMVLENMLNE